MIHALAPHFLWPFAVRYATHQLNLWPRVSLPETSPTLRWTGKVGDASVFRVWGSRAFVRDTSVDKLSSRAIPFVFLGNPQYAPGWQIYHPTSRRVLPSQDVTFDESGPAPSDVSQVDPLPMAVPVKVAVDSGAARGAASGGAASWGAEPASAEPGGAEPEGAGPGGADSEGAESGGAEREGAEPGGTELEGAVPGGNESGGAESGGAERKGTASCAARAGGFAARGTGAGGAGAAGPRGARTSGTGASEAGGVGGIGAGDPGAGGTGARDPGAGGTGAGGAGAGGIGAGVARASSFGGAGVTTRARGNRGAGAAGPGGARTGGTGAAGAGGVGARGAGAGGTRAGDPGAGGAGAGGAGASGTGAGGTVQQRPFFVPPQPSSLPPPDSVLHQVLSLPQAPHCLLFLLTLSRQTLLQSVVSLTLVLPQPVRPVGPGRRVPRPCPSSVPSTHITALCPSSVPLRVPLPSLPASSLLDVPDPESDLARAARLTVPRLLAIVFTDPSFESTIASALVVELVDFAAASHVLEDKQEDFESLAAAVPHVVAMLLAPEGDSDAPHIPTPRSFTEAITGPYSSQWQTAIDAEMASWKSTGTYVDAVPPGANIVDGMGIFRVKRPPGSPPVFKARYVAQASRDYELHSLDFSTAFLQGSVHEEIWLRRPPGFTGSFPAGTQWSLRWPVYGLCQVPRKWHDTLRTSLAALGFAPSTADLSLFLRTDTSLPPFYILEYVDDLIFAMSNTEALTLVKSAQCTITLTQSHMVHQVLQRFGFRYSSPQSTPLPTGHSLSAPPSNESVEPSGLYPELVGCLIYLMTWTRRDLAYPLSILARYVAPR
ncbi:unnamed protein product [Closterium sp. NIES-54]